MTRHQKKERARRERVRHYRAACPQCGRDDAVDNLGDGEHAICIAVNDGEPCNHVWIP